MINGEPNEFLDHINHDDAAIKFRGKTYFLIRNIGRRGLGFSIIWKYGFSLRMKQKK